MIKKVRLLAMDVDGTLTDGMIHLSSDGELFKSFSVYDGMGIKIAKASGIKIAVITGRVSKITEKRVKELEIDWLFQGILDKKETLELICEKERIDPSEVAYIGDDLNDLDAIRYVGISFAPSNSVIEVKKAVDIVLEHKGGDGAVRECVDIILEGKTK